MFLSSMETSGLICLSDPLLPTGQSVTPSRGKREGRDMSGSSSLNMTDRYEQKDKIRTREGDDRGKREEENACCKRNDSGSFLCFHDTNMQKQGFASPVLHWYK